MTIDALEGRTYGGRRFRICAEKVAEFIDVTGDDAERWDTSAPPGYAAALLFVVAPDLVADPILTGPVVHGDQTFAWHRPLAVESSVTVSGTVERVRSRNDTAFLTFLLDVVDGDGPLVEGRSTFLIGASASSVEEIPPPPVFGRASTFPVGDQLPSPRSASRMDLVRYAGATRDWNPIHWDHGEAVAAGLGGVVVHGLLQSAWLTQVAATARPGPRPIERARHRFRSPLRPGQAAEIGGSLEADTVDLELTADGEVTVSARFEMAP